MRPSPSPPRPDRGLLSHLLRTLSWAAAIFGAVCLGLTGFAIVTGSQPLIIKTGSMRPSMPVGTVALVRLVPASGVRVGEVVAVRRSDGKRIMHRVVSLRAAGGGAVTMVVKGDRNRRADPPLTVTKVERPFVVVPWLGQPIEWLDSPWVQYWLGVLTGGIALAWLLERRRRGGERPGQALQEPS